MRRRLRNRRLALRFPRKTQAISRLLMAFLFGGANIDFRDFRARPPGFAPSTSLARPAGTGDASVPTRTFPRA
jgi:hypothetical protein